MENDLRASVSKGKKSFQLDEASDEYLNCMYETNELKNLQFLKSILNNPPMVSTSEGVENYKKGYTKVNTTPTAYGILNADCYIVGRNKLWLPKILKESNHSSVLFITVGAAHVSDGKAGLVELLANEGFTVERIEN
ncbi:MAG: TraB/GumN family protein [Bdellovibrionota bacterium]